MVDVDLAESLPAEGQSRDSRRLRDCARCCPLGALAMLLLPSWGDSVLGGGSVLVTSTDWERGLGEGLSEGEGEFG